MKSLNLSGIDTLLDSSLYHEMRRMEEAQLTWMQYLQPIDSIRKLNEPFSAAAKIADEFERVDNKYLESIRSMLDPIEDIRKSLIMDSGYKKLVEEIQRPLSLATEIERVIKETTQFESVDKAMRDSVQSSFEHAQKMIVFTTIAAPFGQVMKTYEEVEKRWAVPAELVDSIGALKAIQDQFGKLTLPILDVASAATLAKLLGPQGLESQLAALGINPDGSLRDELSIPEEEGIGLSRKSLELMTLLSLILAILVPIYQELSSREWQQQTDDQLEAQRQLLQIQARQFESLSRLVEQAIVQEAKRSEQRFVVKDRVAVVRNKPEHGATVEGKLFPREVVKPISERGKWIQIEYYHWLLQNHQTGWALKKYFKSVPASHRNDPAIIPNAEQNPVSGEKLAPDSKS